MEEITMAVGLGANRLAFWYEVFKAEERLRIDDVVEIRDLLKKVNIPSSNALWSIVDEIKSDLERLICPVCDGQKAVGVRTSESCPKCGGSGRGEIFDKGVDYLPHGLDHSVRSYIESHRYNGQSSAFQLARIVCIDPLSKLYHAIPKDIVIGSITELDLVWERKLFEIGEMYHLKIVLDPECYAKQIS